jgi:hypothetical protein
LVLSLIAQKEAIKTMFLQESGCGEALEERERKKMVLDAGMRVQIGSMNIFAGSSRSENTVVMPASMLRSRRSIGRILAPLRNTTAQKFCSNKTSRKYNRTSTGTGFGSRHNLDASHKSACGDCHAQNKQTNGKTCKQQ